MDDLEKLEKYLFSGNVPTPQFSFGETETTFQHFDANISNTQNLNQNPINNNPLLQQFNRNNTPLNINTTPPPQQFNYTSMPDNSNNNSNQYIPDNFDQPQYSTNNNILHQNPQYFTQLLHNFEPSIQDNNNNDQSANDIFQYQFYATGAISCGADNKKRTSDLTEAYSQPKIPKVPSKPQLGGASMSVKVVHPQLCPKNSFLGKRARKVTENVTEEPPEEKETEPPEYHLQDPLKLSITLIDAFKGHELGIWLCPEYSNDAFKIKNKNGNNAKVKYQYMYKIDVATDGTIDFPLDGQHAELNKEFTLELACTELNTKDKEARERKSTKENLDAVEICNYIKENSLEWHAEDTFLKSLFVRNSKRESAKRFAALVFTVKPHTPSAFKGLAVSTPKFQIINYAPRNTNNNNNNNNIKTNTNNTNKINKNCKNTKNNKNNNAVVLVKKPTFKNVYLSKASISSLPSIEMHFVSAFQRMLVIPTEPRCMTQVNNTYCGTCGILLMSHKVEMTNVGNSVSTMARLENVFVVPDHRILHAHSILSQPGRSYDYGGIPHKLYLLICLNCLKKHGIITQCGAKFVPRRPDGTYNPDDVGNYRIYKLSYQYFRQDKLEYQPILHKADEDDDREADSQLKDFSIHNQKNACEWIADVSYFHALQELQKLTLY